MQVSSTCQRSSHTCDTGFLYVRDQTLCYQGTHLATVVGACILLVFYTVGFPLYCFRLLMVAFPEQGTTGFLGCLRKQFRSLRGKRKRKVKVLAAKAIAAPVVSPSIASRGGSTVAPTSVLSSGGLSVGWTNEQADPMHYSATAPTATSVSGSALSRTQEFSEPATVRSVDANNEVTAEELQKNRENMVRDA
jgi:hypothetical protein